MCDSECQTLSTMETIADQEELVFLMNRKKIQPAPEPEEEKTIEEKMDAYIQSFSQFTI